MAARRGEDLQLRSPKFRSWDHPQRRWSLGVSAPLKVAPVSSEEDNHVRMREDEEEEEEEGRNRGLDDFDPGASPPFKLADIRAAIPKHCWVKDPWRSMSYVVRDVAVVFGLAGAAAYLNNWVVWPLYWAAQGTMFWALFVLGHDWYLPDIHCLLLAHDHFSKLRNLRCFQYVLITYIVVRFVSLQRPRKLFKQSEAE